MKLIITEYNGVSLKPAQLMHVSDIAHSYTVELHKADSLNSAAVSDAEIIYGFVPPALLPDARNLRWLHLPSAGADKYSDLSLFANRDILLTNSAGVYGIPVAEHAISMMLTLGRAIPQGTRIGRRFWRQDDEIVELYGSTVLVVGLGDIGQTIAARLKAFDCRVLGVRNNIFTKPGCIDEVFSLDDLSAALPKADYVVLCLPRTKETIAIMDEKMLSFCKTGSIIVNVGRGCAIDTDALIDCLADGRLRAAGLDVTDPEPLPDGHPLYDMPNVLLTPHVAGLSPKTDSRRFKMFVDLLRRYINGSRLYNQIDFLLGY